MRTTILTVILTYFAINLKAQLVGADAYFKGNFVEFAISGDGGFEGVQTASSPVPTGFHQRGDLNVFGMYANPQMNGWSGTVYDGDFFTPGSNENGWGIELIDSTGGSVNPANNCSGTLDMFGVITSFNTSATTISSVWEGSYFEASSGFDLSIKIEQSLNINDVFYTTTVTFINNGADSIPEFYYYRAIDAENNQSIGGGFATDNTIIANPPSADERAQVVAKQFTPWISAISFVGNGSNFRAAYGGSSIDDGSDIWNGAGAWTNTTGATTTADESISLAYKIVNFAPGATESFHFFTVFADSLLNNEFEQINLLYAGAGTVISNDSLGDTVYTCGALDISVDGFNLDAYDWTWTPNTYLNMDTGISVTSTPLDTITYTVTGTPVGLGVTQTLIFTVIPSTPPIISITNPGPQCSTYDLSTLVFSDLNLEANASSFHSEVPSNAFDMSNSFSSTIITPFDSIFLMMIDSITGCFDVDFIDITWQNIFFDLSTTPTSCVANTGTATISGVTVSPGTYDILWSTGDTVSSISGLAVGIISVTVTDTGIGSCATTLTDTIVENLITVDLIPSPAGCGNPTGSVNAIITSVDSTSYTYSWSDGSTSSNLTDVFGDVYTLNVINADGCTWFGTVTVPNVTSSFSISGSATDASCVTCPDGFVNTFITGTPEMPVTYLWNNGDTTANIDSLLPGVYILITTDAIECTSIDTFIIGPFVSVEEINLDAEISVYPNPTNRYLNIKSTGIIKKLEIVSMDGKIIYTYKPNDSTCNLDLEGIEKGIYAISVFDENKTYSIKLIKN